MKILLMVNPNVGKSVVFSRLTGARVIASNYPGTTVSFTRGYVHLNGKRMEVIDVPETYTLNPTCKAEKVAVQMLEEAGQDDLIINVVDATRLERNLNLTLQLLERSIPVIMALNMWDDAKHKGINIDIRKLEELLSIPVVPTVAVSGEGIRDLVSRIPEAGTGNLETHNVEDRWSRIGSFVTEVQRITYRHHTFRVALMMGFLRKDVAVGMLAPLGLTTKQLAIATTVLAIYFPCIAAFVVLLKELGIRDMAKSAGIMLALAIVVGSLLDLLWRV